MTSTDNQDPPLADDMLQAIARMTEIATEQNLSGRREDLSPAAGRQRMEQERAWWNADLPAVANTVDTVIKGPKGDIPVRLIYPTDAKQAPGLVYLHGGGWVMGSLETHHRAMRYLALKTGAVVIAVDYSLSPEARFPVALEESRAVYDHIRQAGKDYGIDPDQLVLGGDSAGGNLAAALALDLRDAGDNSLKSLLLFYGVFNNDFETASYQQFADGRYGLSREMMMAFFHHYLGPDGDPTDPRVAVQNADLKGLPPTHVYAAELDVLCHDSIAFNTKLRAAGVPGEFRVFPGMVHAFINLTRMVDDAHALIDQSAAAARKDLQLDVPT